MNPGGLRRRVGTYRSFRADMVAAARESPALARLNAEAKGDFTVALLAAWARVCDSLAFYQERIANEGYLSTAVEPESVLQLAAAIGARRQPAIAAETWLAFRIMEAAGQPDRLITEPSQPIVVQTVPSPAALPVVFECDVSIELRAAWNAMKPVLTAPSQAPTLFVGCRSLRLPGTATGIRAGGALLLASDDPARCWLVVVAAVAVDRRGGWTVVTWAQGIGDAPDAAWPCPIARVTAFARPAGLFGRDATRWADLSPPRRAAVGARPGGIARFVPPGGEVSGWWRRAAASDPPGTLRALLVGDEGRLVAGTDKGLFVSLDAGIGWTTPLSGPRRDVLTLLRDDDGRVYAGCADGSVLESADEGASWAPLPDHVVVTPTTDIAREILNALHLGGKRAAAWPLRAPVRAIATTRDGEGGRVLYIGTDVGVFTMALGGRAWRPFNAGAFPGIAPDSGTANIVVASMIVVEQRLVAVTDEGLFASDLDTPTWERIDVPLPLVGVRVLCVARDNSGRTIFVGTSVGVLATPDLDRRWIDLSERGDAPAAPVRALVAVGDSIVAASDAGVFIADAAAPRWRRIDDVEVPLLTVEAALFDPAAPTSESRALLVARFARAGIDIANAALTQRLDGAGEPVWEVQDREGSTYRLRRRAGLAVSKVMVRAPATVPVVATAAGELWSATPTGNPIDREWPDFTNPAGTVVLDRTVRSVPVGQVMLIVPSATRVTVSPTRHVVAASERLTHRAFGRTATVTRITISDPPLPPSDLRASDVYLDGRDVLALTATAYSSAPVTGRHIALDTVGLAMGRVLQLSGPRAAVAVLQDGYVDGSAPRIEWFAAAPADAAPLLDCETLAAGLRQAMGAGGATLSAAAVATPVVFGACWLLRDGDRAWQIDRWSACEDDPLRVVEVPLWEVIAAPVGEGGVWRFLIGETSREVPAIDVAVAGVDRFAPLPTAVVTIAWQPARTGQAILSEVATVAAVTTGLVSLAAPVAHPFDPAALRICANVARATQGQTISNEILGSGDRTRGHQGFRLHHGPLTWRRDRNGDAWPEIAVEVDGRASKMLRFGALRSEAAGAPWHEVARLEAAEPAARVFEITTDAAGASTLRFGDGRHGARLPSGRENVVATYRAGAGASGNVAAGALVALRKRAPGIRSVVNPLAASGGSDTESIDALRARAPRRLRTFDRIVTRGDYRAAAAAVHGVMAAKVDFVAAPDGGPSIVVTVATTGGDAAEVRQRVHDTLDMRRSDRHPLHVLSPEVAAAQVALALDGDADAVAAVRSRLAGITTALGEPLEASVVRAAAAAVPGVRAVELLALAAGPAHAGWDDTTARLRGAAITTIDGVTIEDLR